MERVPYWFQRAVQDYDRALQVKWCPAVVYEEPGRPSPQVGAYAIERQIHATAHRQANELKAIYRRNIQRPVPDGPHIEIARTRQFLRRRKEWEARLDALNRGYRVILFIPDTLPGTLRDLLYTLRTRDLWSQYGYQGNPEKTKHRAGAEADYEDTLAERRKEAAFRSDLRYLAGEFYMHRGYASGDRAFVTSGG